jgi:exodeoxyribonuclease-3
MKSRARDRNVGWRIDYFFVTSTLIKNVKSAFILDHVMGSDHAPVGIEVSL